MPSNFITESNNLNLQIKTPIDEETGLNPNFTPLPHSFHLFSLIP